MDNRIGEHRVGLGLCFSVIVASSFAVYWWLSPPDFPREVVFRGGEILSMNTSAPDPEALLIRDGRIIAVGSEREVSAVVGESMEYFDLQGTTLMPGLIEPHTHPIAAALTGAVLDVSGITHSSRTEVMTTLREAAEGFSLRDWILAFGWDPVMVADLDPPTLAELDEIAPDRPMLVLTQMMHDAYANSAALAAAGIDGGTPDPPGGEFVRDEAGKLTGTVRETSAIDRLVDALPPPPARSIDLLLSLQYGKYARAGYTTIGVLGPVGRSADPIALMQRLAEDPGVPLRTVIYALPAQLSGGAYEPGHGNDRFRIRGVKFWIDGSPFAGGAALAEPYEDTWLTRERLHLGSGHMGTLNYEANEFELQFAKYHRAGFQIATHVQGERAVDLVLAAAKKAQQDYLRKDARHRLEHNALITQAQLVRAKALGMTTSFFVDHIYFYGKQLPNLVGPDRTKRYMPLGTAARAGHRVTIHTDNPATPIAPFRALRTAVLRQPRDGGEPIALAERLDVETALRGMTIEAAWQLGAEDEIGSLEPGKRADLVRLSANPMTTEPERLTEIEVLGTWVEGRPVDARTWTWRNVRLGATMLWKVLSRQN
ncbi:MAG: amidohydrolase [Candidatus Binatia bacterium]